MTTYFTRSALVFHGGNPAADTAYVVSDHSGQRRVTWAEVLEERRCRQKRQLEWRRSGAPAWRAVKLWVAYFDQPLMGGWHAFIEDIRGRNGSIWIDRDGRHLQPALMELVPLVLGTAWEAWKVAFAREHRRRSHHRRPLGVLYLWWNGESLRRSAA